MKTAIKIQTNVDVCTSVIFGRPEKQIPLSDGDKIQLFPDGKIVCYQIKQRRTAKAYLFRTDTTLGNDLIVGVQPHIDLLCQALTKGKVERLRNVITYLIRNNIDIDRLTDTFFLRLNCLLGDRVFHVKQLKAILSNDSF